ncbi:hypothetical protein EW146_g135 [Bondarzewia mesenterica]|uniref:Gfo/Idh/MocA-like oxidoreductase N-terminal domain-containing protein n=1 Tax=Bondarzewia mesenterica TaxID=1095465 RepID=A0A4S4M7T0_9AGAM|nr:hypothetical protein EW146_g135 [Bondarzewia mesenterica]
MASDAPGFAILGAGIYAKEGEPHPYLPAIAALPASPLLKAVYSRSEKSASDLATAAQTTLHLATPPAVYCDDADVNLGALLARSDIHAVIVALPITAQPDIILKALAAGKHVLSEKPIAPDVARAVELIRTYESEYKPKGLIWRVAENYEMAPVYRKAAQAIREGKIGEVLFFRARIVNYMDTESKWYKTAWRTVPDYQGGFLLDGGVHFAAALRVMLPSPLTHLSAFTSLTKSYLAPADTLHAIVRTASSKIQGLFELSFGAPSAECSTASNNGFTITGSKGWLVVGPGARLCVHTALGEEEVVEERTHGVEEELKSFFEAGQGKDDGMQAPRSTLRDLAFIQAALTSGGAVVDLEALAQMAWKEQKRSTRVIQILEYPKIENALCVGRWAPASDVPRCMYPVAAANSSRLAQAPALGESDSNAGDHGYTCVELSPVMHIATF